jgi:hypothetical protein
VAQLVAIGGGARTEGLSRINHVFEVTIQFATQDGRQIQSTGQVLATLWNKPSVGSQLHIRYDAADPDDWTWSNEDAEPVAPADGATPLPAGYQVSYGDVQVVNASGADPASVIEKLERLRAQGLITDQQLQAAQSQISDAPQRAPGNPTDSTADRLRQLDQLRDQRLVSDAEYEEQRRRLLDSI